MSILKWTDLERRLALLDFASHETYDLVQSVDGFICSTALARITLITIVSRLAIVSIKRWLCDQFTALDSVRGCVLDREADVVVYTWGGTIIHVHLLETLWKARQIKKVAGDNSRVGIGTLFLVNAKLVPRDGEKIEPDEGLLALHGFFKDKIYTFRVEAGVPRIGQVHFKSFGRSDEREVWYGPDIEIRSLPCYRVWVKAPNSIKGEWLVANFGSDAFWKHADYTAGRDAFRRAQRQGYTRESTWSNASWNDGAGYGYQTDDESPPSSANGHAPTKDTKLVRSYAQLGVTQGATSDEVKTAFRKLARELHPDVSTLPKDEAERRFKTLNEAYTYIKTTKGW